MEEERQSRLFKNTAMLTLGNVLSRIISLFFLPIITAKLTKIEYGEYDLLSSVVTLLMPAATLQISAAAFRFLIDKRNDVEEVSKIITNTFAFSIPLSLLTIAVYFFVILKTFKINNILTAIYLFVDIMIVIIEQIVRGLGHYKAYSQEVIVRAVIKLFVLFALMKIENNFYSFYSCVLISLIVSTIVAIILLILKISLFKYIKIKFIFLSTIKKMISYSGPLVINDLSQWVLKLSDRIVITTALGLEATATYGAANKIPSLLLLFQNSFNQAWHENASMVLNDEDKEKYYSKTIESIITILTCAMLLLMCVYPILFKILIKGDYLEAYNQIPILLLAIFFSCTSSVLGGIYIAFKETKKVQKSVLIAAIVNLFVDVVFVKKIGITAGSVSTLTAYFILTIYRIIDIQKIQKIIFSKKTIIEIIILIIMTISCYINFQFSNIVKNILTILVVLIIGRNEFKKIWFILIDFKKGK